LIAYVRQTRYGTPIYASAHTAINSSDEGLSVFLAALFQFLRQSAAFAPIDVALGTGVAK
jgi:hypothetical protein